MCVAAGPWRRDLPLRAAGGGVVIRWRGAALFPGPPRLPRRRRPGRRLCLAGRGRHPAGAAGQHGGVPGRSDVGRRPVRRPRVRPGTSASSPCCATSPMCCWSAPAPSAPRATGASGPVPTDWPGGGAGVWASHPGWPWSPLPAWTPISASSPTTPPPPIVLTTTAGARRMAGYPATVIDAGTDAVDLPLMVAALARPRAAPGALRGRSRPARPTGRRRPAGRAVPDHLAADGRWRSRPRCSAAGSWPHRRVGTCRACSWSRATCSAATAGTRRDGTRRRARPHASGAAPRCRGTPDVGPGPGRRPAGGADVLHGRAVHPAAAGHLRCAPARWRRRPRPQPAAGPRRTRPLGRPGHLGQLPERGGPGGSGHQSDEFRLQCADVDVPKVYTDASAGRLSISVVRASGPKTPADAPPLFVVLGRPGRERHRTRGHRRRHRVGRTARPFRSDRAGPARHRRLRRHRLRQRPELPHPAVPRAGPGRRRGRQPADRAVPESDVRLRRHGRTGAVGLLDGAGRRRRGHRAGRSGRRPHRLPRRGLRRDARGGVRRPVPRPGPHRGARRADRSVADAGQAGAGGRRRPAAGAGLVRRRLPDVQRWLPPRRPTRREPCGSW